MVKVPSGKPMCLIKMSVFRFMLWIPILTSCSHRAQQVAGDGSNGSVQTELLARLPPSLSHHGHRRAGQQMATSPMSLKTSLLFTHRLSTF